MDFHLPLEPDDSLVPCRHGPVSLWLLVTLIVAILGLATAAANLLTDERTVAERHATVLERHLP